MAAFPPKLIERSAHAEWPLCTCLIASADSSFFPEMFLECTQIELKRAIIDLDQAIVISLARRTYPILTSLVYLSTCVSSAKTLIGAVR